MSMFEAELNLLDGKLKNLLRTTQAYLRFPSNGFRSHLAGSGVSRLRSFN